MTATPVVPALRKIKHLPPDWSRDATFPGRAAAIAVVVLLSFVTVAQAASPSLRVSASEQIETVFNWRTQRCDDLYLPDSPARAFRRSDGTLALIAAHYTNGFFVGSSFSSLKPDCAIKSLGGESNAPEDFDTRFWVQALWPLPGDRILALVSHEYLGKGRPGQCNVPNESRVLCWYSYIGKAIASEKTLHFVFPPLSDRFAAAPPIRHDPDARLRAGFFTTSNIVTDGLWAYFVSWMEFPNRRGNCLFRAPLDKLEGPWLALRKGQFTQSFPDPYRSPPAATRNADCDVIGQPVLPGPLRSIVRLERHGVWMGVFQFTPPAARSGELSGTFASYSSDLINWSPPQLIFSSRQPWGQSNCQKFYEYPSLIDHASSSRAFDTAGDKIYLYLTRFNYELCAKGLDRDLVRLEIVVDSE